MTVYDFNAKTINGQEMSLEAYKGKVLIIVNTIT
jgi:glutathione peroxidase